MVKVDAKAIACVITSITLLAAVYFQAHAAFASDYSAYAGESKSNNPRGVIGGLKFPATPHISASPANNHRDLMVYVNMANSQSMGSGAYAWNNGGTIIISAAEYYYDAVNGATHIVNNSPISVNTLFTAKVEQTTSTTSDCWRANTANGNSYTRCFSSTTYPLNNVGNIAQAPAPVSYSYGVNDDPGFFDGLLDGVWEGSNIVYNDYFSNDITTTNYKCISNTHGYVLDPLYSYTGSSHLDDRVGTGPEAYLSNTCNNPLSSYEMFGE